MRLLISHSTETMAAELRGADSIIRGTDLVGSRIHDDLRWQDDGLHLLNLFTRDEELEYVYDVVLVYE